MIAQALITVARRVCAGLILCAALWLPAQAQEQLRLRANEHSAFSRIAIDVPDLSDWRMTQKDRTVEIVLPGRDAVLDVRAIFPDRRVSRVLRAGAKRRGADTVITLGLACRCEVEAYDLAGKVLMLDVRDAPREVNKTAAAERVPEPAPEGEQETPAPMLAAAAAPIAARVKMAGDPAAPVVENDHAAQAKEGSPGAPGSHTATLADDDLAADAPKTPLAIDPPAKVGEGAPDQNDVAAVIAEAQRRLLEQLTRAAEQGLVNFRKPDPATPDAPAARGDMADDHVVADDAPLAAPVPAPEVDRKADAPVAKGSQFQITSVLERDARKVEERESPACIPDSQLTLPVIESAKNPSEAIASHRRALLAEFDKTDKTAATNLARVYVALGFGAEAVSVVNSLEVPIRSAPLLRDMGYVVDGSDYLPDGPFARAQNCGGQIGIWRLAAPSADGTEIDESLEAAAKLAEAMSSIAPPLRHLLGPGVLTALVNANRLDAARQMVAVLARAPGPASEANDLAVAKFYAADGRSDAAEAILLALTGGSSPAAAEATALLVERMLARGAPVDDELIAATAAAGLAYRGAPLGPRLKAAEIRARGGGRFVEALDVLETEIGREGRSDATLQMVAQELFRAATPDGVGAAAYAGAAIARAGFMGDGPASDLARETSAGHLTDIGLANAALIMIAPGIGRSTGSALMAARAHVALGQGAAALALLDTLDPQVGQDIRVAALVADGRHKDAWQALDAVPEANGETRAAFAWRAGDWQAAASLAPASPRAPFAAWMSRIAPEEAARAVPTLTPAAIAAMGVPEDEAKPSLSGARALLARSRAAESLFEKAMTDG